MCCLSCSADVVHAKYISEKHARTGWRGISGMSQIQDSRLQSGHSRQRISRSGRKRREIIPKRCSYAHFVFSIALDWVRAARCQISSGW